MTRAIACLKEQLGSRTALSERAVDICLFLLCALGVAYLLFKTWQVSEQAEYDFKYLWVAGEAWVRGINPYSDAYHALGKQLITFHHVPVMWVYPPSWYLPAVMLTVAGVNAASVLWNIANIVLFVAASALLTASLPPLRFGNAPRNAVFDLLRRHLAPPWNVFFLHVFVFAVLQATALTLSVGQTSILVYFGTSLLIFGLARGRRWTAALGLAIVFLKPQMALLLLVALAMSPAHRALVARAIAISAAASLPAFVVAPTAGFDFLVNLTRYDGFTSANWPQSTTGLRILVWDIGKIDPGNVAAMLAAITAMAGLYLALARGRRALDETGLVVLASAATVALAPLHVYDLVLLGVLPFTLAQCRPAGLAAGALGAALAWRAGDVAKLTGFYGAGTQHFEGSRLATLGALLMLAAVFAAVRRGRVAGGTG